MYVPLSGSLEVICGPMFSGKTEELIRRIRRAQIARLKVQVFKPTIDNRYHESAVVSHSSISHDSIAVKDAEEILTRLHDSTRVVAIDEAQFFSEKIVDVVRKLTRRGLRVVCAGLDLDFKGQPFGPMPVLLALADEVHKIHAICTVCGHPASKTYRKSKDSATVVVGETDIYEARCTAHWDAEGIFHETTPVPALDASSTDLTIN